MAVFSELFKGPEGLILLIIGAGWFLSIGLRYVFPALIPYFQSDFGISLSVAGALLTTLFIGYAIGQFPGGLLSDIIGEGLVLLGSVTFSCFSLFLIIISTDIRLLFIGTFLYGLGNAFYATTRYTIFTDIYPENAGAAVGLISAAGSIGNTVLPIFFGLLAAYIHWNWGFIIVIPFFLAVIIGIYLIVPARTSNQLDRKQQNTLRIVRRISNNVRNNGVLTVTSIHVILLTVSLGFLGFYPTYLIEVKGYSSRTATIIYGTYFAFGIGVQPLAGSFRDKFSEKYVLFGICGLITIGLLLLPLAHLIIPIVFVTLLLSSRNGLGVVTNTFIATKLDEDVKGTGLGLLRFVWTSIGAISPLAIGYIAESHSLNEAFLLLAGLSLFATLLALSVPH